MRILLVNPKYPQTFWSFNRVLQMLGKKVLLPPLGLITVAALLPREWEMRLVELTARDLTEDDWNWSEAIFFTGLISQYENLVEVSQEARRRGKTVVIGGPLVFHDPEMAIRDGVDIVVKGEAEVVVQRLVEALENHERGVIIEARETADLERSPVPRYDLLDMDLYVDMGLQFSRGCPFRCEFCDITLMFGRRVRTKSPAQILAELQTLYDLGWRRAVFFVDDNFVGNVSKARALLGELIPWMAERSHPFDFYTQASVNLGQDDRLMDAMVRAGFWRVFLGIESPDQASLEGMKKYQNASVDLNDVCQKINRAGFQIIAGCILGFDDERPGADRALIDFAVRNHIPEMFITLLQAAPGTDLWTRLEKEGRLAEYLFTSDFGSQTGMINFRTMRPLNQIVDEFINLYETLYEPEFYLARTFEHFARMKPLPYKKGFQAPRINEIRAVLITLFRQGLMAPTRLSFWKFFFAGLRKFPDRFRYYLASCVTAEHYYDFRQTIAARLREMTAGMGEVPRQADRLESAAHLSACDGSESGRG